MQEPKSVQTERPFVEVVDDNPDLRELVVNALRVMGYEARSHASAEAFLNCPPVGKPMLIVVDIRMPGMSGLDLHRQLRASGNGVPMILISGDIDMTDAEERLSCTRVRFMWKPFSTRLLRENLIWGEELLAPSATS